MRTTLAINVDVLAEAKHRAEERQLTVSEVIATLARQGLSRASRPMSAERNGVPLLPNSKGAKSITMELVNQLSDEHAQPCICLT